jgi:hypothetical protein
MKQLLLALGVLALSLGFGLVVPVVVSRLETGAFSTLGIIVGAAASLVIACGIVATLLGVVGRHGSSTPSGVRAVILANLLFLAFFALEFSDGFVRQNGRFPYWTDYLFLPVLALFFGLVAGHAWAWWASRIVAALGCLWFVAFLAVIPFAHLEGHGGIPTPWYGRVYMACVTLAFAGVMAAVYRSLGRPEARRYFGRTSDPQGAAAEPIVPSGPA